MVKKYEMNESLSWKKRYKELEAHHIEETTELYEKLKVVRKELKYEKKRADSESWREDGW